MYFVTIKTSFPDVMARFDHEVIKMAGDEVKSFNCERKNSPFFGEYEVLNCKCKTAGLAKIVEICAQIPDGLFNINIVSMDY